jgi:hypothetical protein
LNSNVPLGKKGDKYSTEWREHSSMVETKQAAADIYIPDIKLFSAYSELKSSRAVAMKFPK